MVYIVTYNAAREQKGELIQYFENIRHSKLTPTSKQIEKDWVVDLGDDPSFLAYSIYKHQGGKLSWGICRKDVRANFDTSKSNTVVFIAHCENERRQHSYHLTAICMVDTVLNQWDIVADQTSIYNKYANVLLRPDGNGDYIHKEWYEEVTGESRRREHDDWLWRLGGLTKPEGKKKKEFVADINAVFDPVNSRQRQHQSFNVASIQQHFTFNPVPSYVLFSTKESFIIANPPIIARFHDNIDENDLVFYKGYEKWESSKLANTIHDHLFGARLMAHMKYPTNLQLNLRTKPFNGKNLTRGGYPHRHKRFELEDEIVWRQDFIDAITRFPDEIERADWS